MRFAPGRRTHQLGLVAATALCLVFAASAAAEVRSGSASDGAEPERIPGSIDIVEGSASYDTAGSLQIAVTTVAPPSVTEEFVLTARFGVLSGGECVEPLAAIVGSYTQPPAVAWGTGSGDNGEGSESISGRTTTLGAASPALANQAFNCVEPAIYEVGEEGELVEPALEGLTAPIQLIGPPPPPAPVAPPAATPPPAPPAPKVANLALPPKAVTVHRNAWRKVTIKITNIGDAAARKVSLQVGRAKGVAIRPKSGKLKLKSIAPGKSKAASFKVKLGRKAKARSRLTVAVKGAKGVTASGILTLEAWKKPRPKKGKPPAPANAPLPEKIFYAYKTEASHSATLIGYAFIDGEWAFHGIPTEGLPSCTEITGNAEHEGCVKYRYDSTTGSVRIGSLTGRISPGGALELDGETYFATATPAAGARLQVEQEFIGFSGLCGLIFGCSTWHEHLVLTQAGEFVLSTESLTTMGGSGPGQTFIAAGSYPPDQHGTYAIEKGARIKLSFADGTVQTKTIAIFLNKEGKPDPVYEGLLIGTNYFTFANSK